MSLTGFFYNTQRLAAGYYILARKVAGTIALVWLASGSISALAADGYVQDVSGQVSVTVGANAPRLVAKNDTVASGMVVRTGGNGHAVLKFADGQLVSLQANSTFQIREYRYVNRQEDESSIAFSMLKGGMRFVTGQIGQRNPKAFRLVTPHATIRIHGTEFMVVIANNATYTNVLSGSIGMTNAAGTTIITAGQTALATSATTLATIVPATSVPAGTFTQFAAVSQAAPSLALVPTPSPVPAGAVSMGGVAATTTTSAATAGTTAAPSAAVGGGAAAGGAAASTATLAATGISATTIGIGVGVAAVAAAVLGKETTTTTHH